MNAARAELAAQPAGSGDLVDSVGVSVYRIPTDAPESDGTLEWDSTTMVIVEVHAGDVCGIGYSYTAAAAAPLIRDMLAPLVVGRDPFNIPAIWMSMVHAIRNLGRPGICSTAIAAVDVALWDLKSKRVGLPLVRLLGGARAAVPIYGSGGFTSYSEHQLRDQLGGWAAAGLTMVKMKVGRDATADPVRVAQARDAIGPDVALFVDANGGYSRKEALALAASFADLGVTWFEEPVSSDDLAGLKLIRDRAPGGMAIAAGEYGYDLPYFERMLEAGAVDVLQADATRAAGITGFLSVEPLCAARSLDLSAHCGPSIHLHPGCALPRVRHLEYFHDHVRIEHLFFDGAVEPVDGRLAPDLSRSGLGLEFRRADAEAYRLDA
ncbi:MAG: mandelate racemase [Chloroflexota bacterium]|nr:mandelate racemase [Chloroflexota bacterium]